MMETTDFWWNSLRHEGLLLDQTRLGELQALSAGQPEMPVWLGERLRLKLTHHQEDRNALIGLVLDVICHFSDAFSCLKAQELKDTWSCTIPGLRETIRPDWLYLDAGRPVLPLFIDRDRNHRLGLGRGRILFSKVLRWQRTMRCPLALMTNGLQWRLVYASLDSDAFCEWDSESWFANGQPSPEFQGFLLLLSPQLWRPETAEATATSRLLQAIQDSRRGQNELSGQLGERVRQAVELLIREHGEALGELPDVDAKAIYMASVRMVMRLVVIFFAESREGLLPKSNAIYSQSYSLGGLLQQLKRHRGNRESLAASFHAWPRLLALMKLIYTGSSHEAMPVAAYGGKLFEPGDADSPSAIARVTALFEREWRNQGRPVMSDAAVLDLLVMLAETRVRIRQQQQFINVPMPMDFSSLGNEYIGILFESLLNFELKRAAPDTPIVFVNVGDQPALPLNKLEQMSDRELADLFKTLRDNARRAQDTDTDEDTESAKADADSTDTPSDDEPDAPTEENEGTIPDEEAADELGAIRKRTLEWAARACRVTGIVRPPRTRNQTTLAAYESDIDREAKRLVSLIVEPGQWYLVRWGGTRKGSGTFYTKPQLAIPTVERTLAPLVKDTDGNWRRPEEILAIRVCDPACGSGSFLLAALRFLTSALYDAILAHGRLQHPDLRNVQDILAGTPTQDVLSAEQLPGRPDDDDFEPRLKAILRRHIVENCIYGVDLDPVAVELCRLALWIETLDRSLPMTFLDHKVKCGNSLVGTWSDQFVHYPLAAWLRDGGDKGHQGVHFADGVWYQAIREKLDLAKGQIVAQLDNELHLREYLSPSDIQERLNTLRKSMEHLHALKAVDVAEQARLYEALRASDAFRQLKRSFDLWCALWFWPGERLELAPLPNDFAWERLSNEQHRLLDAIADDCRFFHWELEFPEVFGKAPQGFDAILGNPPWDIAKPKSQEFFSNVDPLFRTYGKQVAKGKQREYFTAAKSTEEGWLHYCAGFKAMSNWIKYCAAPFGDRLVDGKTEIALGKPRQQYHQRWGKKRGAPHTQHPFTRQGGGDINLYKLFLEQAYCLGQAQARIGLIIPSGIYSDNGTKELRQLLFDHCSLEWLFSFENRKKIFDIHRSYKFNPVVAQRGGNTVSFKAAFMRQNITDWENAEQYVLEYPVQEIKRFSPESLSVLEIQTPQDLNILSKIYDHSILMGDDSEDGWGITFSREFDMTNDSHLFPPQDTWRTWGYEPDEYSRWIKGPWKPIDELYALPEVQPHVHALTVVAQPPYNTLRVRRCDLPVGVILSRDCTRWLRYDEIPTVTFTEANGKTITYKVGTGKNAHVHAIVGKAIAIPLYQGRMVSQFNHSHKIWISGASNKAVWGDVSAESKYVHPNYLMGERVASLLGGQQFKSVFRAITNATNKRTLFCALLSGSACGNKLLEISTHKITSVCQSHELLPETHKITSLKLITQILNSLTFDWVVRFRLAGIELSQFIMQDCPLIRPEKMVCLESLADKLNNNDKIYTSSLQPGDSIAFAQTSAEKLRLMVISDAVIAKLYGLNESDYRFVLADCDYPAENLSNKKFAAGLNPKGFWRVDRELEPELRQTVLSLVAFMDLEQVIASRDGDVQAGIEAFLRQHDGEGWMLPETLCLADYGLGHDERAKHAQPVASRLGPRFFDWQLQQSPEEFQRECALHAANLELGTEPASASAPTSTAGTSDDDNLPSAGRPPSSQLTFNF